MCRCVRFGQSDDGGGCERAKLHFRVASGHVSALSYSHRDFTLVTTMNSENAEKNDSVALYEILMVQFPSR